MAAMQALGPEMKKLQQKYKGAENRAQINEEMMKLYKEHNVNPASGCLPMLLQMPAFFILYSVIRGITNTVTIPAHTVMVDGLKVTIPAIMADAPVHPRSDSKMYHDIVAAHGQLNSFGIELRRTSSCPITVRLVVAIPYLLLVIAAVGLQYLQMSRLNARNPQAAQANPQAAMMQKYMPLIFGFIYLNVAAILNVYFIVSSAIRILTQEVLFRKGIVAGPGPRAAAGSGQEGPGGGPQRTGAAEAQGGRGERGRRPKGGQQGTARAPKWHQSGGGTGQSLMAPSQWTTGPKTPAKASTGRKPAGSSEVQANGIKAQQVEWERAGGDDQQQRVERTVETEQRRRFARYTPGRTEATGPVRMQKSTTSGPTQGHPRSKAKRERKAR